MSIFNHIFKKRENYNNQLETERCIMLFGKKYDIEILVEMEAEDAINIPDEFFHKKVDDFVGNMKEIQNAIENYVRTQYRKIIEDYYLDIDVSVPTSSWPKKHYQELLLIFKDYSVSTTNALDIVLKNIKPVYFSVYNEEISYLFLYMNDADGDGLDVILSSDTSDITIKYHDGLIGEEEAYPYDI